MNARGEVANTDVVLNDLTLSPPHPRISETKLKLSRKYGDFRLKRDLKNLTPDLKRTG